MELGHLRPPPPPATAPTWAGCSSGLQVTIALSLSAWVIALALGSLDGRAAHRARQHWLGIAATYVEVFRNIPLLVQLFIWYFVLPGCCRRPSARPSSRLDPSPSSSSRRWFAWRSSPAPGSASRCAPASMRCPGARRTQGLALGFTLPQTYRHVLLPMAFRLVVPPLTSEFRNIFKNSAVCSTIGLLELAAQGASWWITRPSRMSPSSR